jgi:hypothetical protein
MGLGALPPEALPCRTAEAAPRDHQQQRQGQVRGFSGNGGLTAISALSFRSVFVFQGFFALLAAPG